MRLKSVALSMDPAAEDAIKVRRISSNPSVETTGSAARTVPETSPLA